MPSTTTPTALIDALAHGDEDARIRAAADLGQIGGAEAGKALAPLLLDRDTPPRLRREVLDALLKVGPAAAPAVPGLLRALREDEVGIRMYAGWVLQAIGDPAREAVRELSALLRDDNEDPTFRIEAARTLGRLGGPVSTAAPPLVASLRDRDPWVRLYAARALGELADLRHSAPDARRIAHELAPALEDEDHNVRRAAAFALGELGGPATAALASLVRALADPQLDGLAAEVLARLGQEAVPALVEALAGSRGRAASMAAYALRKSGTPAGDGAAAEWEATAGVRAHVPSHADFYIPYPDPAFTPTQEAEFEAAFSAARRDSAAGSGANPVRWPVDVPKAAFLHYMQKRHGVMFHSSNDPAITILEPRHAMGDGEGEELTGVYGMPYGVYDMFFAIVDRKRAYGLSNGMFTPKQEDGSTHEYLHLSVDTESVRRGHWTGGMVYLLPPEPFERTSTGWISWAPVQPLARVPVSPADFPFLDLVRGFEPTGGAIDLKGWPYLDEARRYSFRPKR